MKSLLLVAAIFSSSAFAYTTGDKIVFQHDSAWISILNKSLCVAGDHYQATLTKCVQYNGREDSSCAKEVTYTAYQPIMSNKKVCTVMGAHDRCEKWEVKAYFQSPTRVVNYYSDEHDTFIKSAKVTARSCQ